MRADRTNAQSHSWWCGPATMQMIAWGWRHDREPQRHWADKLGTTTDGSAITSIVRLVNRKTGYDSPRRAGPYVVLDISDLGYRRWFRLTKKHIADYRAPLVLHPALLSRFYPYLDYDASGHFQVGRGYKDKRNGIEKIGFFEPWNQQAFDPLRAVHRPGPVAQRLPQLPRQPGPPDAEHGGLSACGPWRPRPSCAWSSPPRAARRTTRSAGPSGRPTTATPSPSAG